MAEKNSNRGSGSMNERERSEISRKGGESSGEGRGSSKGNSQRGLASADKETRQRVAREGGKSSSGGGRKSSKGGR